jgi:hypothetical protein
MIKLLLAYIYTVKNLKPKQIFYRIYYTLKKQSKAAFIKLLPRKSYRLLIKDSMVSYTSFKHKNTFLFLNQTHRFYERIDWNFTGYGMLWAYNLNYFEFLHQSGMDKETGLRLMHDYIAQYKNIHIGYDSYPVSLRNIFWIRFISKYAIQDDRIDAFLYDTYIILLRHLEYHLLGNHLLENAFSLLFGAYYFRDKVFYCKAYALMKSELKEQILQDGGHFELSPMYHQILLYRLLDCINVVSENRWIEDDLLDTMGKAASLMLSWLNSITFPSGNIPLLNDSSENIAPSSSDIFQYAGRLRIARTDVPLSDSNYRVFKTGEYTCIFDIGGITPAYQPGHAHADTFNIALEVKQKPVLTDTGCSTYQAGAIRMFERGTAAHNTVVVNERNSSQIWSRHRVGKRARVLVLEDNPYKVTAQHTGYRKNTHIRSFLQNDNMIEIIDTIEGKESKNIAFFHLDTSIENISIRDNTVTIAGIQFLFEGSDDIYCAGYEQAAGFNKRVMAKCICADFGKQLKTRIHFLTETGGL